MTSLAQVHIAQFASISQFIDVFVFDSTLEWKTHLLIHFAFMCTFSCVFTFTGLLASVSVLVLEYSCFLLEYSPIRAWPISKRNLNWSLPFYSLYGR